MIVRVICVFIMSDSDTFFKSKEGYKKIIDFVNKTK